LFNISGLIIQDRHLVILRLFAGRHVQYFFGVQDKNFFVVGHFFNEGLFVDAIYYS